jgi:hypothetical protein
MARNSSSERQLLRAASDAGFRVLPPMVRLLWFELLAFAAGAPEKGRLRFLHSVSSSVARLLSLSETEVETGLETLAKLGLVEEDAETNSLWMPGARAGLARVDAAKVNGMRGGRPRKGETLEQYHARRERERFQGMRQGHLMMPISGGQAETQETEAEPNAESSRAVLPTTSLSTDSSSSPTAREETALVSLAVELAGIAKLEGRRFDAAPVQEWLEAGASAAVLRRAVQLVASRGSYAPERVNGWGYFNPAVREAMTTMPTRSSPVAAPAVHSGPSAAEQGYARQYLDMVSGKAPSTEQERARKEGFMRRYAPAAWALVEEALGKAAA